MADGATITLRRLEPRDAETVVDLYEALSDDECYFRFFTPHPAHVHAHAQTLTQPSTGQYAIGAFASKKLLGVANYVAREPSGDAEVAVVVAHTEHLHGVGTALLRRLGAVAKANGIHHFVADVLAENRLMLNVLSDVGWACVRHREGAVLHIRIELDGSSR